MAKKSSGKIMGAVKPKRTGGASKRREGTAGSPVGTKRKAPGGKV